MPDLTIFALVAGTFAGTNMDNLAILVGWMVSGHVARSHIAAGYALSIATVIFVSAILGLSSKVIPVQWIGWLGVIPIGLGAWSLIGQFRGGADEGGAPAVAGSAAMFGVAATLVANSVDTVIVFSPLLVDTRDDLDPWLVGVLAVTGVIWFLLAMLLSRTAARMQLISRIAGWITPFIMIGVGLYILSNTATDVL